MKKMLTFLLLIFSITTFGQSLKLENENLTKAFKKISYWASYSKNDGKISPEDSLESANDNFQKLLLEYTSTIPQTLNFDFENLKDSGLTIVTSEDGLFRIYTWNTNTGGTMHVFRNVFQYKQTNKIFSKTSEPRHINEDDPGCSYYQINDIIINKKKYYITQCVFILSSGLSENYVQIFSIDNFKLKPAKIIKTKSGITNQLGYEVDRTASVNRDRDLPDYSIKYDRKKKSITIPVILDNGKVTGRKIVYQFNGAFFEKN